MNNLEKYIENRSNESEAFREEYIKQSESLDIAVALTEFRKELGLTQQQLAEKVGKPQSTIARIENGNMNPSFNLLKEIVEKLGGTFSFKISIWIQNYNSKYKQNHFN